MVIKPSRSLYSSKILDEDSISLIKDIFKHKSVDCSQLQIGGTLADIDGYLELCDEEGRSIAKLTVQVKHITIAEDARNICYDVPISLYGYCKVHKGEVVIFIACDTKNERFFWMHINNSDVDEVEQNLNTRINAASKSDSTVELTQMFGNSTTKTVGNATKTRMQK